MLVRVAGGVEAGLIDAATVFLVARTLSEAGKEVDWIDTPPPYETRTLTIDQVLEMQQDGVTFESHSATHADLTRLSHAECLADYGRIWCWAGRRE